MESSYRDKQRNKIEKLTETPKGGRGFLGFPVHTDLNNLDAEIAILGVPYGLPYTPDDLSNDQSTSPDLLRENAQDSGWSEPRTIKHFDWDLGGPLLDNRAVRVVDCGNVTADFQNPREHYRRAEVAAKKIFQSGAVLVSIGGDHGIPIPIMKALPDGEPIILIQIDAHMDWRDSVNGEKEGYSSPIRRASELPFIEEIYQIGLRGVGSGREEEVKAAKEYGANLISAYEMHQIGMQKVLNKIPNDRHYYITIDADGMDPTIMPAVNAPTPGGLNWLQLREFIHEIVKKGRVLGLDLVEISPSYEKGNTTFIHAERLLCNFIGAIVRANYFTDNQQK